MQKQKLSNPFTGMFSDAIQVSYVPVEYGTYEADLYGYIEEPSQFSNIISVLGIMKEQDTFVLNLQSGGGNLDASDAILHAMYKCLGHIHVVATGNCSSAATLILLSADSYELSNGFNALLHGGSLGSGGTYSEYRQQTAFFNKFMEKTLREAYVGFLTEAEMDSMLDGRDIILDAEGWQERYDKRNEYFKNLMEQPEQKSDISLEDSMFMKHSEEGFEEIKTPPTTKRKVKQAPEEGSISREEAKKAVKAVFDTKK